MAGYEAACFKQKVSGYYWPGTFQQYVTSSAFYVTPIPEGLSSDAAAPMWVLLSVLFAPGLQGC